MHINQRSTDDYNTYFIVLITYVLGFFNDIFLNIDIVLFCVILNLDIEKKFRLIDL